MMPLIAAAAAPLVQELMSKGLNLIASAVANKGKDYVEGKLGVKLTETISDEKAFELKRLEFEHEEELLRLGLEERKMEFEDLKSARSMGAELSKSESALQRNIVPVLAILSIVGGVLMILLSQVGEVRMAGLSIAMMPLAYYFGTSQGSKQKQEQLMNHFGGKK
jgi:hypothetical protein